MEEIQVELRKKMPKSLKFNGLDGLAERVARGNDTQYVLLAVQPTTDARSRADGGRKVTVEILALEGLALADHRRAAERMLREARVERMGHEEQELPIPEGERP